MTFNKPKIESHVPGTAKYFRKFTWIPTKLADDSWSWLGFYYVRTWWGFRSDEARFDSKFDHYNPHAVSQEYCCWSTPDPRHCIKVPQYFTEVQEYLKQEKIDNSGLSKALK